MGAYKECRRSNEGQTRIYKNKAFGEQRDVPSSPRLASRARSEPNKIEKAQWRPNEDRTNVCYKKAPGERKPSEVTLKEERALNEWKDFSIPADWRNHNITLCGFEDGSHQTNETFEIEFIGVHTLTRVPDLVRIFFSGNGEPNWEASFGQ
jgi:hypothetical protein